METREMLDLEEKLLCEYTADSIVVSLFNKYTEGQRWS